ncbi:hypothetical protein, variant [Aphanomyces invadans]|uniref:SET domain-containing protein n=1 Tax=Aphanomyces invadans TaxID=157072 RepID=A0A024TIG0_9STRA|nr:hypothetical protein, variant [Aphanomyces invadans]ETV93371.1 hypothetical protein, variant [Aphanomyces invadans]|eukprot:XP_008878007.1 hypothetical protein, variant [Aphanomyces invadans]
MTLDRVPVLGDAAVAVLESPSKGRYVVATSTYQPGDVVFQDQAFVYASCNGEHLLETKVPTMANLLDDALETADEYHPSMHRLFASLLTAMRGFDTIGEVDRAKCILKCVTQFLRHPASLDGMMALSYVNEPACVDTAQQLVHAFPAVFTQVSVPVLAKIIGVLNTNSHELEGIGGTGLFLSACLMEHSCAPNCSFTTDGHTLWVTAIRPIEVHDAMSIDYGNLFYRPRHERQQQLQQGYGFACVCRACTDLPDKTRAYLCRLHGCPGLVHPFPTQPFETYQCTTCGQAWSRAQVQAILHMERELEAHLPTTHRDILRIESSTPFHRFHYLLFWALDSMGLKRAPGLDHDENALGAMWSDLMSAIEYVAPDAIHEKVIYYDQLAQVQVLTGDIPGAVDAYGEAYRISCVVSGAQTPPTLALYQLMHNPPRNRSDLIARYGRQDHENDEVAME